MTKKEAIDKLNNLFKEIFDAGFYLESGQDEGQEITEAVSPESCIGEGIILW